MKTKIIAAISLALLLASIVAPVVQAGGKVFGGKVF